MQKSILIIGMIIIGLILTACGGGDNDDDTPEDAPPAEDAAPAEVLEPRPPAPDEESLPSVVVESVEAGNVVTLEDGATVILAGVNTPPDGHYLFDDATQFTRDLLDGKTVNIEQMGDETVYLWVDGLLANYEIVRAGYATRKQRAEQYDGFLEQAEAFSFDELLGVWSPSTSTIEIDFVDFDPAGIDNDNLLGEFVRLENRGEAVVNMEGYTISDSDGNIYTFPALEVAPFRTVLLFTGCAVDTQNELYWCQREEVWNNSGDTVFVTDAEGLYVDHRSYAR